VQFSDALADEQREREHVSDALAAVVSSLQDRVRSGLETPQPLSLRHATAVRPGS
jgi:hypothetical protein